jgi:hypothetical protein
VLLKIVYLLTCRVLSVAVLVFRGDGAKDAELLVLRHENAVLRRHVGRVRYEPADRVWFAALALCRPNTRSRGLTCCFGYRSDTMMVGWPGAAQDHLPAHALDFWPGCPDVPQGPGE